MEQNTETALLVMDMQAGTIRTLPDAGALIGNVAKAIANAREKKIPVIYVVVGFRQGIPEVSSNNKTFAGLKERVGNINMDDFMKVHPDIAPQNGEVTVIKRRISAFTGSDLAVILSAFNIKHLVLTGVATSGVVLSTIREAADKDYRLTVLADCCADGDEEVHRVLTTKIFPRQANVLGIDEWSKM